MDKAGKVLIAEPGGPAATVEAVKKLVEETADGSTKDEEKPTAEEAKATNGEADEKKDDEKNTEEAEKADE